MTNPETQTSQTPPKTDDDRTDAAVAKKVGLLTVPGFRAQGVHTGLKKRRRDVGVIVSDRPASVAAVFTQNSFAAAPVQVSRQHLSKGDIRAIVVNSGNANACTGQQGLDNAREMTNQTAGLLGLDPHQVLVCSTGIIGRQLDMTKVVAGIEACISRLDDGDGSEIVEAILTTDSFEKVTTAVVEVEGRTFRVAGIAKGAGMIHPNMATMLGYLVTDAPVEQGDLQALLKGIVDDTFNMISVDGDESTNDTVIMMANGAAGGNPVRPPGEAWNALRAGIHGVARHLARMIPSDGEGATRLMEIEVVGAQTKEDARRAARQVSSSSLVKSAVHGGDPNWGRIVAALGQAGVAVDPSKITIRFEGNGTCGVVLRGGISDEGPALKAAADALAGREVRIHIDLGLGEHHAEGWGCDLTQEYVRFNSAYST